MGQAKLTDLDHTGAWPQWLKECDERSSAFISGADTPIILRLGDETAKDHSLEKLVREKPIVRLLDVYDEQLAELYVGRNPQLYQASYEVKKSSLRDTLNEHYEGKDHWRLGSWVYFPWSMTLVHMLDARQFEELRTLRNKELINEHEQRKFASLTAGFAGMSVGSNAVLSTVIQGGCHTLKISDGAVISGSNLNRIIAGVGDVGTGKSLYMARRLFEMNPYQNITRFTSNLDKQSINDFFDNDEKLDIVVDEIDDLAIKILLRIKARERKIPVVMATDLGDDAMLDVERFDLEPDRPLFHGLAGSGIEELLDREVSRREWLRYATMIINAKNVPLRMQQSLLQVGTKLVTQPQLGGAAMMAGISVAYALKKIALGEPMLSGRYMLSADKSFMKRYSSYKHQSEHRKHTKKLKKILGSL